MKIEFLSGFYGSFTVFFTFFTEFGIGSLKLVDYNEEQSGNYYFNDKCTEVYFSFTVHKTSDLLYIYVCGSKDIKLKL